VEKKVDEPHEHSGRPTKSLLLVRATMSAIVLIAGTVTHSIETVERIEELKAGNREPTVFLGWDEVVEGGHDFVVDIWKSDAEVTCDWLKPLQ
jgi:hypothetical protein